MSWEIYALLIVVSLGGEAFFSMMEMAILSFNKIRLQYYAAENTKQGVWLMRLIHHPTRLFGTTLIGVNAMLFFGSECARRFYLSLGLSPDWAPLSQILLILLFAELSPMFAARRFPEQIAFAGAPIVYFFSLVLWPVTQILGLLCRCVNFFTGVQTAPMQALTREEIQRVLEEREETSSAFESIGNNVFHLKGQTAGNLSLSANRVRVILASATVKEVREAITQSSLPFLPIVQKGRKQVIGVCFPKDLLRAKDEEPIRPYGRPAWYISEKMGIFELLKHFRVNNQSVAIVVDNSGSFSGVLCLDDLTREIFNGLPQMTGSPKPLIARTYPSQTLLSEVKRKVPLDYRGRAGEEMTLEEVMAALLGHRPITGEKVICGEFELTMQEAGIIRGKRIRVCSR